MVQLEEKRLRMHRAASHITGSGRLQRAVEQLRCAGIHVGDVEHLARVDVIAARLLRRELGAMRRCTPRDLAPELASQPITHL